MDRKQIPVKQDSFRQQFRKQWPVIKRRVRYGLLILGGLLGGLGIFLIQSHAIDPLWILEEGWKRTIMMIFLIVIIVSVIQLIIETSESVDNVSEDVKKLLELRYEKLLDLRQSITDLKYRFTTIKTNENVSVRYIGLNLGQSWNYFKQEFLDEPKHMNIKVRILALPNDSKTIKTNYKYFAPDNIDLWCNGMIRRIGIIKKYMAANKERLRAAGLELEVEIKQYSTLPYIHGFSVSGAFGVHYVSFCRWLPTEPQPEDGEYEWGENCYHRITDDTPDHAAKDLSLIFDGCFKYLWATSGDTVWSFNIP